jgi:YD repeat-containing protein
VNDGKWRCRGKHSLADDGSTGHAAHRTIDQVNTWGTNIPKPNFGVNTFTNQLTAPAGYSMTYDQAGNLTNDTYTGEGTRSYDAKNRMKQARANGQWQTYFYDGDGRRIKRNVNGTETWQVYGLDGELVAEYAPNASPANPQKEYGYRNGELLVTAEPASNIHWLVADQLGTPRMVFDQTGSLANVSRHDYLPFGEEVPGNFRSGIPGYATRNSPQKNEPGSGLVFAILSICDSLTHGLVILGCNTMLRAISRRILTRARACAATTPRIG